MPRPSWSPEKIELLQDLWTRGVALTVMMHTFRLKNAAGVYSKVQTLRAKGYAFPRRYRGGVTHTPGNFGAMNGGLVIPTTPGHVIQRATIMDANGQAVATMDPASRKRKAL